jgi:homocitrate synthase NifV
MASKEINSSTRRTVRIIDTTLRDGEQAPGISYGRSDKLEIAGALDQAGVDELEVGIPAMGPKVREDIRRMASLGLNGRLSVWCRAREDDLASAARCNVSGVHISFPVSDVHLSALGKTRNWVLSRMAFLVRKAHGHFDRVTIGAQDATRADEVFLLNFATRAEAVGTHQLRIADTVGIGRPGTVMALVASIKAAVPRLPLEFHGHNDLGMATANTLCALEAGARAVSVTVNGMGERAGNTALEQISMVLRQHPILRCRVDTRRLVPLCRMVAESAGQIIPPAQPVAGSRIFTHESGIHCHAMLRDERAYEPFAPQIVGRGDRRFVLGTHSGTAAIRHLLEKAGIHVSPRQADVFKKAYCKVI